jgi:DNA-binding transcriptional ArsR family regulator
MPEDNRKKTLEDPTSRLIHALNHPLRRLILKGLMQGPASASMLAERFEISLSNVSYHLGKVLNQECEALVVVEEIPRRGAKETVYRVKASFLLDVIDWPAIPESMRSGLRALALQDFLEAANASLEADAAPPKEGNRPRVDSGYYLYRPVLADESGQREISKAAEEFAEKVAAVEARCAVVNPADLLSLIVGIASFEAAPLPEPERKE